MVGSDADGSEKLQMIRRTVAERFSADHRWLLASKDRCSTHSKCKAGDIADEKKRTSSIGRAGASGLLARWRVGENATQIAPTLGRWQNYVRVRTESLRPTSRRPEVRAAADLILLHLGHHEPSRGTAAQHCAGRGDSSAVATGLLWHSSRGRLTPIFLSVSLGAPRTPKNCLSRVFNTGTD